MRFAPRPLLAAILVAAAAAPLAPAFAADTTTFNVKLIVLKACTITAAAATDVDFGSANYDTATNLDAQGSVTARCSPLTPYSIALNAGANAGTANDVTTRRMKNTDGTVTTNNYVAYQLYRDTGRSQVWGSTTGTGGNVQTGTGTGANQAYPVYGRVANLVGNNASAGSYLDTVTATITY